MPATVQQNVVVVSGGWKAVKGVKVKVYYSIQLMSSSSEENLQSFPSKLLFNFIYTYKGAFNYYESVLGGRRVAEKLTFAYQNGGTGRSKGKMLTCLSKIIEQQYQTRKPSF